MADRPLALVVAGNRGVGLGVVKELLARGTAVIATARQPAQAAALVDLARLHPGRLEIAGLDLDDPAQIDAFPAGLAGRTLDLALLNAGIYGPRDGSASTVTAAEIGALIYTNAIAPIRLARHLIPRIRRGTGVLAFTSSIMGSVTLNQGGGDLYRASKATLNILTRGLQGEAGSRGITLVSLHPGWVRSDMGGPHAAVSIEDSARGLVNVMQRQAGRHQHAFLDYTGKEIAW